MNATEILLRRHENLHSRSIPRLLDPLTEDQIRTKPRSDVNSIAWLIWHIARCTDVGNRLVVGCPQVLDEGNWMEEMNVPLRIYGTGMSDDEADALSREIDIPALRAYLAAVAERTGETMRSLTADELDEEVGGAHLRRVLIDEGTLGAHADWVPEMYASLRKGDLLAHLAVTHNYGHQYEASVVSGLLGVRRRPDDGQVRAVPEWQLDDLPV